MRYQVQQNDQVRSRASEAQAEELTLNCRVKARKWGGVTIISICLDTFSPETGAFLFSELHLKLFLRFN